MTATNRKTSMALAAAAAALFITLPTACSQDTGKTASDVQGKCIGGNACKGQSACAAATTSCAGQNACKGEGFTTTTKSECDEAGGEWEAA
jgi:hypothetical protein